MRQPQSWDRSGCLIVSLSQLPFASSQAAALSASIPGWVVSLSHCLSWPSPHPGMGCLIVSAGLRLIPGSGSLCLDPGTGCLIVSLSQLGFSPRASRAQASRASASIQSTGIESIGEHPEHRHREHRRASRAQASRASASIQSTGIESIGEHPEHRHREHQKKRG